MHDAKNLFAYRELISALAWKNISVRYKQAYLGILWALLKPLMLVIMFTIVRSFVGIDTDSIPYPVLTFAALMPWVLFQESAAEGVNSVVGNSVLIRKIYFPREVFPLTATITKLIEFGISALILVALMTWYGMVPTWQIFWAPLIVLYTLAAALAISFAGAALNVYYRDVAAGLPVVLSLMMYLSPIIYPLALVKRKLLEQQAAGQWSDTLYLLYTANPLAGIIEAFQRSVLMGLPPDLNTIWPGMITTALFLPFSYAYFKRAEAYFADVI